MLPPLGASMECAALAGVLDWNYIAVNQSSRSITNCQAPDGKLKFLDQRLLHPSLFLSPGAWGPPPTLRQEAEKWDFVAFFFRFFALPSCDLNFASKKHRKKCENQGFWLPKPLPKRGQNPFKIDVPKNMRFFIDFCSIFAACCKSQHRFRIGFYSTKWLSDVFLQVAFCMDLGSKKPTKNP